MSFSIRKRRDRSVSLLTHRQLELETLEPRVMLSTVQVIAAGSTGTEQIELEIDGAVVRTWTDIGDQAFNGQTVTRTFNTDANISAGQVRINFVNDAYDPANNFDRNVRIDAIVIDGVRYETEAAGVYASGTWIAGSGISEGNLQTEYLNANGYFQFTGGSSGNGSTYQVRARGDAGGEQFRVWVAGNEIGSGSVSTSFQTFQFTTTDPAPSNQVWIEFSNDLYSGGIDRNLIVDYVAIDGQVFQTEADTVYSTGTWRAEDGITPGYRQSQWLHTDGYFQFNNGSGGNDNGGGDDGGGDDGGGDDGGGDDGGDNSNSDAIDRINAALPDGWTQQLFNNGTDVRLQTYDVNGNAAFNFRFGSTGVISSIVDSRNGRQLVAPTYQGEITDRVVQSVLWEVGPRVRHDVPSLSNDQDRFNLTQAGTVNNQLNRTVDVNVDASSGTLDVWSVIDRQWQPELQPHISGSTNMLTRYETLDSGAVLVRRIVRVGDISLNGQAAELSNPILVGWFPWADDAFNAMALGINAQGVPNYWYANDVNVPTHQNQPIDQTRGWAMVYNRNNLAGGTTMSVVYGLDAGTIKLANGGTTDMRRMLFNSLDFDTGLAFNPALWTAPLPAGSIIDQSYIMVPGRGIQAGTGQMLDTLAAEIPPPQVYHPGAQMDSEMAAIASRLNGLAGESSVRTDRLGQV